jgi:hypothetical protein
MIISKWNPAKRTIHPRKELCIDYDPGTDILTLWTGTPASNDSDIAQDLMMFFDEEGAPQLVTLEGSAKLLRPYPPIKRAGCL